MAMLVGKGLKCFDSGWPGLDVNPSIHLPAQGSISFLVDDIGAFTNVLRFEGVAVDDPDDLHLGMRAFELEDPDGHRVEIQSPTDKSPQWIREMVNCKIYQGYYQNGNRQC